MECKSWLDRPKMIQNIGDSLPTNVCVNMNGTKSLQYGKLKEGLLDVQLGKQDLECFYNEIIFDASESNEVIKHNVINKKEVMVTRSIINTKN